VLNGYDFARLASKVWLQFRPRSANWPSGRLAASISATKVNKRRKSGPRRLSRSSKGPTALDSQLNLSPTICGHKVPETETETGLKTAQCQHCRTYFSLLFHFISTRRSICSQNPKLSAVSWFRFHFFCVFGFFLRFFCFLLLAEIKAGHKIALLSPPVRQLVWVYDLIPLGVALPFPLPPGDPSPYP